MTPDARHCLAGCQYLPRKRQAVVELASGSGKIARRFGFYPSVHAPRRGKWPEIIEGAAKRIGARQFEVHAHEASIEAKAATFDDLLALAGLVEAEHGQKLLILDPERQFLVSRGWSYFDSFEVWDSGMKKIAGHALPEIEVGFLPKGIDETISELLPGNEEAAQGILSRIALSNILCIKPEEVKESRAADAFLERMLFDAGISKEHDNEDRGQEAKAQRAGKTPASFALLDFSCVLSEMLTSDFMNAGHETLNCGCCRPPSSSSNNVMPSSLALVEFKSDGIYFNSNSAAWAEEFHQRMPQASRRAEIMKEWCLSRIPAGPFEGGQRCEVPLADALKLQENGSASIIDELHKPVWFCTKQESRLSKSIRALGMEIAGLEQAMHDSHCTNGGAGSIACYSASTNSAQYAYLRAYHAELIGIASSLHNALTNPASMFFEQKMADAISTTLSEILSGFREFSSAMGERNTPFGGSAMLVDAGRALVLAKGFAASNRLPMPKVAEI